MTDAHLAPSFTHTRTSRTACRAAEMAERRVEITNPDGTTTVHTFWTDSQDAPPRVEWGTLEDVEQSNFYEPFPCP